MDTYEYQFYSNTVCNYRLENQYALQKIVTTLILYEN